MSKVLNRRTHRAKNNKHFQMPLPSMPIAFDHCPKNNCNRSQVFAEVLPLHWNSSQENLVQQDGLPRFLFQAPMTTPIVRCEIGHGFLQFSADQESNS